MSPLQVGLHAGLHDGLPSRVVKPQHRQATNSFEELWSAVRTAFLPLAAGFAVLVVVGLAVGLVVVGRHGSGPLHSFNVSVDSWFPAHRYGMVGVSKLVATVFDAPVLGVIALALSIGLWFTGARARCLIPFVAYLGAEVMVFVLKAVVDERRPTAHQVIHESGRAFPSGHATAGMALLVALGGLVATQRRRLWPWVLGIVAGLAVAGSRLVLGVHWFGDVAIGALLGAAWGIAVMQALAPHERSAPSSGAADI